MKTHLRNTGSLNFKSKIEELKSKIVFSGNGSSSHSCIMLAVVIGNFKKHLRNIYGWI